MEQPFLLVWTPCNYVDIYGCKPILVSIKNSTFLLSKLYIHTVYGYFMSIGLRIEKLLQCEGQTDGGRQR